MPHTQYRLVGNGQQPAPRPHVAMSASQHDNDSQPASECACFSLCHPEEVRYFFIRLPIVTHEASPWYPYLLAVYHTLAVPLPFDMRTLGATSKAASVYPTGAEADRSFMGQPEVMV